MFEIIISIMLIIFLFMTLGIILIFLGVALYKIIKEW